jgi:hypothetical protein
MDRLNATLGKLDEGMGIVLQQNEAGGLGSQGVRGRGESTDLITSTFRCLYLLIGPVRVLSYMQ